MQNRENPALLQDERKLTSPTESPLVADPVQTGQRASDRTNVHDEGSDANDTVDGLTESEEAVRQAAEDLPLGQRPEGSTESIPCSTERACRRKFEGCGRMFTIENEDQYQ